MAEARAVRCFTPPPAAVIYYTVTVHLNTVMQPRVPEHHHCRCDPLTMKLDHSSAQVSVRPQSVDLSTHVEDRVRQTLSFFYRLKMIENHFVTRIMLTCRGARDLDVFFIGCGHRGEEEEEEEEVVVTQCWPTVVLGDCTSRPPPSPENVPHFTTNTSHISINTS